MNEPDKAVERSARFWLSIAYTIGVAMNVTASSPWEDLMVPYLAHLRGKRRSPRTIELRQYQIGRFFRTTGLAPADVTIDDLRTWMDRPEWAPNTAAVVKASLSSIFGYLHDEEILPHNPAKRLEAPKSPSQQTPPRLR